jgi:hypothetical protein
MASVLVDMASLWCHIGAMILESYVQTLREDVAAAAETWGDDARELADRLTASLESAIRLTLLEALSTAAAEITSELAPGSVELRLRGREPEFVVTPPPVADVDADPAGGTGDVTAWVPAAGDDATLTRINLRLPQELKDRVEEAARLAGLSVNAWLVRSAASALPGANTAPPRPTPRRGNRYSGWVR